MVFTFKSVNGRGKHITRWLKINMATCYTRSHVHRLLKNSRETFWERWISNWTTIIDLNSSGTEVGLGMPGATAGTANCCSVAKSCRIPRDPMDCCMPGFPVLFFPSEFAQIHVHWVGDAIYTISSSVNPFFFCLQSFPASESFPVC